jgi:CHRD domain-containing protein
MSTKMPIVVIATIVITATITVVPVTITGSSNLVFAEQPLKFVMNLSGSEEVPPVQTEATGVAEITPGVDSMAYSINATKIEGVTAGHIHLGAMVESRPIVVTLFKYDTPMNEVSENGTFTANDLEGPYAGKQISDIPETPLYVNIHTEQNPNGEIRGQP